MARRLVRTRAADRDLVRHTRRIRKDRPATARRFLMAAQAAFRRLQRMPEIGAPRPSTRRGMQGARMWPIPQFRVFLILYRVIGDAVEIVRVIHAAEDITRYLPPKDRQ